ncbi:hypothetical protein L1987_24501 [Smallanthus sonchifolius]|uniref:Uncharacterized protein n=1 Tax=Smallanthus sonchifolius TaxID=185202 RepID=A0ACB9ILY8_9ASTR|nr:hypothetical protein L1987_24501 [Smallanthus sonchifolius]
MSYTRLRRASRKREVKEKITKMRVSINDACPLASCIPNYTKCNRLLISQTVTLQYHPHFLRSPSHHIKPPLTLSVRPSFPSLHFFMNPH